MTVPDGDAQVIKDSGAVDIVDEIDVWEAMNAGLFGPVSHAIAVDVLEGDSEDADAEESDERETTPPGFSLPRWIEELQDKLAIKVVEGVREALKPDPPKPVVALLSRIAKLAWKHKLDKGVVGKVSRRYLRWGVKQVARADLMRLRRWFLHFVGIHRPGEYEVWQPTDPDRQGFNPFLYMD